uniref:Uncharacterized protein n=1 Tax=Globodera rostochiensis TaxID=31243 RepID=A0A914HEF1_GLORO
MSSEEGEIHGSSEGSDQQQEEQPLISFREKISTHKKTILVYDGFEYAFDKISRSDPSLEFYRCLYRDKGGPNRQQAADENPIATRQAVDNARNIIPADVRGQQGTSAASMGRSYRNYVTRERAEYGDELLDRADPAHIVIPDRLQEQTIFDDVDDGRRMFVFASPFARNILAQYGQHVAIDGTFKCAPLNFTQLYTISVLLDNVAIPCVYELAHYFVLTWIGCDSVMGIEPIDEFDDEDEYGAYGLVDQHIRNWIEQNGYQQRRALFPMEIWNMCARIEDAIGRTNNSVEAWHKNFNAQFRSHSPRFSTFLRVISKEENHWRLQVEDYEHNPANGIRGKGMPRKQTDVEQFESESRFQQTRWPPPP